MLKEIETSTTELYSLLVQSRYIFHGKFLITFDREDLFKNHVYFVFI
jgi:hypothetical protein